MCQNNETLTLLVIMQLPPRQAVLKSSSFSSFTLVLLFLMRPGQEGKSVRPVKFLSTIENGHHDAHCSLREWYKYILSSSWERKRMIVRRTSLKTTVPHGKSNPVLHPMMTFYSPCRILSHILKKLRPHPQEMDCNLM